MITGMVVGLVAGAALGVAVGMLVRAGYVTAARTAEARLTDASTRAQALSDEVR